MRRRAADRGCAGQSEPAGRSLRPRPSRRGRTDAGHAGCGQPRTAGAGILDQRNAGAGSVGHAASRGARHGCRCSSLDRAEQGVCRKRPDRDAPARSCRPHRADGRVAAERPAGSLASRFHAGAAHQRRRPHRARRPRGAAPPARRRVGGRAHRRRARPAQQRTPHHRAGSGSAGRSRSAGLSRA